jgi:hypothetical protein
MVDSGSDKTRAERERCHSYRRDEVPVQLDAPANGADEKIA